MQAQQPEYAGTPPAAVEPTNLPPIAQHVMIEQISVKPIWSLVDLSIVTGTPVSTLNEVVKANPAPFFLLGRRKVMFREDALAWLREVAARNPWSPRTNNQQPQK